MRHPPSCSPCSGPSTRSSQERGADMQQYWMLNGQAFVTLGVGTFLAALPQRQPRVHRDGAEELYAALPTGAGRAHRRAPALAGSPRPPSPPSMTAVAWLLAVGTDGRIVIDLETLAPSLLGARAGAADRRRLRRARRGLRPLDAAARARAAADDRAVGRPARVEHPVGVDAHRAVPGQRQRLGRGPARLAPPVPGGRDRHRVGARAAARRAPGRQSCRAGRLAIVLGAGGRHRWSGSRSA